MSRLAAFAAQTSRGAMPWLVALSACSYLLLGFAQPASNVAALCGRLNALQTFFLPEQDLPVWQIFQAAAADWILMVVAMMAPLVAANVSYVGRVVHASQKAATSIAFLLGYLCVWILSGLLLVPIAFALASLGGWLDLLVSAGIAVVWSMAPIAQWARNRCHGTGRIAAFGLAAQADGCWFGMRTGNACVLACWPWMLLPLQVETGHIALMALTGLFLFADRVAPPATPAWRLPPALETVFGLALLTGGRGRWLKKLAPREIGRFAETDKSAQVRQ
ncbi:copper chaperone [Roseibium sp. LAB1]